MLPDMAEVINQTLTFETYLIEEFYGNFDDLLNNVLGENIKLKPFAYDKVNPLQIKVGYLRSDFTRGVAKYLN
jgi:hypothetical protein